jgi:hypothetical protein
MYAVKVANGQGARRREVGVPVAAEDFHHVVDYRFYSAAVRLFGARGLFVIKSLYIEICPASRTAFPQVIFNDGGLF